LAKQVCLSFVLLALPEGSAAVTNVHSWKVEQKVVVVVVVVVVVGFAEKCSQSPDLKRL
jgi:hypothetical protein